MNENNRNYCKNILYRKYIKGKTRHEQKQKWNMKQKKMNEKKENRKKLKKKRRKL